MAHGLGLLLLSAVAGYWLLERAESHKGDLRRVGRFLGAVVIVVSLVGVVCKIWGLATCPDGMGKGGFCPYSFKKSSPMK